MLLVLALPTKLPTESYWGSFLLFKSTCGPVTSGRRKGGDMAKFGVGMVFGMLPVVLLSPPSSVKTHHLALE